MKVLATAYSPARDEPMLLIEVEHNGVKSRYIADSEHPTPDMTTPRLPHDRDLMQFLWDSWKGLDTLVDPAKGPWLTEWGELEPKRRR